MLLSTLFYWFIVGVKIIFGTLSQDVYDLNLKGKSLIVCLRLLMASGQYRVAVIPVKAGVQTVQTSYWCLCTVLLLRLVLFFIHFEFIKLVVLLFLKNGFARFTTG